ncbi:MULTISPECIES: hypothetical protein [unclassified Undibacterium]|uniref:hypothetical protein n=1 Tax=unclassified Undibacterium TaxID=2630295 RepID=UPI0033947174
MRAAIKFFKGSACIISQTKAPLSTLQKISADVSLNISLNISLNAGANTGARHRIKPDENHGMPKN